MIIAYLISNPPVRGGVDDECKLTYLSDIDNCIKQHKIPPELILNADQTPSSYVSVGRMTMAATNSQSVAIMGLTDKRNITLTFVAKMDSIYLQALQLSRHASTTTKHQFKEEFMTNAS